MGEDSGEDAYLKIFDIYARRVIGPGQVGLRVAEPGPFIRAHLVGHSYTLKYRTHLYFFVGECCALSGASNYNFDIG